VGEKGDDGVVINNIFNPLRYADRISGKRLKEFFAEDKEAVKIGLKAIAENLADFSRVIVDEGVDGIYLACQGPEEKWYLRDDYREHFLPFDRIIFDAVSDAPFNIIHPHAEADVYLELFADWGAQAICWSCRAGKPSLSEARQMTKSALCSGLDEARFHQMTPEEIVAQGREAIAEAGRAGLILAPGCTVDCYTPEANFRALIHAAEAS
jgi:uroporphyrinogen-III decarboxylase